MQAIAEPEVEVQETLPEPVVVPEPAASETAPVEQEVPVSFDDLPDDPDEARKVLYEGKPIEVPVKAKEPVAEEVEKTPVVTDPPAEVETEAQKAERILPKKIITSQFDEREQRAINLMHVINDGKKPGDHGRIGFEEAMKQLDSMTPGKATEPPEPTRVEAITSKVSEAEAALTALRDQRREAIVDGNPVSELDDQIEAARDAITAEKVKLAIAHDRAEQQQAHEAAARAQTHQQRVAASKAEVISEFPDAAKPDSPLGIAIAETIAEINDEDHPDRDLLHKPSAPRLVLNEALARLAKKEGITPAQAVLKYSAPQAPEAAKPTVKPATQQPRKILPASGSQATQPPKGQPSSREILDQVGDDPEAALAALYGGRKLTNFL